MDGGARHTPRMTTTQDADTAAAWAGVRDRLHARGLRWTPQRRTLVEVLARTDGHVTGSDLVERCRALDPTTTPSTVYRTLDVLEELGIVRHHHGSDGREEFHVLPDAEHGHLHCRQCGGSWEIEGAEISPMLDALRDARGFHVDISHVSLSGRCALCAVAGPG
jgi:Fur family ferric uptake transcriptional regulator